MQREDDFFHNPGTALWFGVCEARDDPAMMGRIRVRIFGYHSPDRTEIPTETLPWASIMLPTTTSGMSGVMSTASGIMEGTWVIGFFRDGPSAQDPVVIGVLMGMSSPRWTGMTGAGSPPPMAQSSSTQGITPGPNALDPKEKFLKSAEEKSATIFDKIKNAWQDTAIAKKFDEIKSQFPDFRTVTPEVLKEAIKTSQDMDKTTIDDLKKTTPEVSADVQALPPDSIEALKNLTPEQKEILKGQIKT
jgi:hypothetical protein